MFKKKVGYTHILKSLNVFKFWNQLEVNVKIAHNLQNKWQFILVCSNKKCQVNPMEDFVSDNDGHLTVVFIIQKK